jgi:hypothetical protein
MNRIILLILGAAALTSCEDIQDNTPAMQGDIDHLFFKAVDARAEKNEDNSYTIQGTNSDEILTLHIEDSELRSYPLGQGQPNYITYKNANGISYYSYPNGTGSIELTDVCISCGLLSGTFQGTLILPSIDTLNIGRGIFFEVSFLEGGILGDGGVANAREFWATVDGLFFNPITSGIEIIGNSLVITGAIGNRSIRIVLPVDAEPGVHSLSTPGFGASYDDGNTNEEAESGIIDVIFNTGSLTRMRFNFVTANHEITLGRAFVDY